VSPKEPEDGKSITPLRDEDGKLNFLIVNCVILYIDRTFLLFWHELTIIDQAKVISLLLLSLIYNRFVADTITPYMQAII